MMVLEAVDLAKTYIGGDGGLITVLDGVNLQVARGEMVAIVGASGAGKSTLLHLLGALDRPTRGAVSIAGERIEERTDEELSALRNRRVGFVFQFHHLLPDLTAAENVALPLLVARRRMREARALAFEMLDAVNLRARASHLAGELSGGEQQRVAIARALVCEPQIVLADEPTGNLDAQTGEEIGALLASVCRERGAAIVVATHNERLARASDRVLHLQDGCLRERFQ